MRMIISFFFLFFFVDLKDYFLQTKFVVDEVIFSFGTVNQMCSNGDEFFNEEMPNLLYGIS